jgi:hypothetical protein
MLLPVIMLFCTFMLSLLCVSFSLNVQATAPHDTLPVKAMNKLSFHFCFVTSQFDSALTTAREDYTIAASMESHDEARSIHCTEEVCNAPGDTFVFEERGEIEVKGKGRMRTWFLTGTNPLM